MTWNASSAVSETPFRPPRLGSRLARASGRVAPMPLACGIGDSTTGGAARARRTGGHKIRPVKVLFSMQIPEHGEEHGSYSFTIAGRRRSPAGIRSEEHTSELQSLRQLVCRL